MKLLLATGNAHKAREMREILRDFPVELTTLSDRPEIPPVVEDGKTLEENAVKKAIAPALASGLWTLSDDTGLEVEALGGRPGVWSARYAGPNSDFAANCRKLLDEMASVPRPRRTAVFRTVVALASPDGMVQYREGRLEGRIAEAPAGENGFGYDPVFYIPDEGRTLAQLSNEEKNRLSHRSRGLQAILPVLKEATMKTLLLCLLLIVGALQARAAAAKMTPEERVRLEAVRDRLSDAVRAKPEDAASWRRLGQVHQALGAAEPARDAFLQVTRLEPSDAGAWSLLALAHEKLEEVPQAIAAWEACAARSKDPELSAVARKHLQVLRP